MILMLCDTDIIGIIATILMLYDTDINGFIAMIRIYCMLQISLELSNDICSIHYCDVVEMLYSRLTSTHQCHSVYPASADNFDISYSRPLGPR